MTRITPKKVRNIGKRPYENLYWSPSIWWGHLGGGYTPGSAQGRLPYTPYEPLASVFPRGCPLGYGSPRCRVVRSAQTEEEQDRRKQLDVLAGARPMAPTWARIGVGPPMAPLT